MKKRETKINRFDYCLTKGMDLARLLAIIVVFLVVFIVYSVMFINSDISEDGYAL